MRNCPRYSRGSLEAEEMTRPRLKKIFFSMAFLVTMSVPVFWPRLSHWSRSPGSMVLRLPLTPMGRATIIAAGCAPDARPRLLLGVGRQRTVDAMSKVNGAESTGHL